MKEREVKDSELVIGRTYKVYFSDCCTSGYVTGVLLSVDRDEDDGPVRTFYLSCGEVQGGDAFAVEED